jgi:hypothetical protein
MMALAHGWRIAGLNQSRSRNRRSSTNS